MSTPTTGWVRINGYEVSMELLRNAANLSMVADAVGLTRDELDRQLAAGVVYRRSASWERSTEADAIPQIEWKRGHE